MIVGVTERTIFTMVKTNKEARMSHPHLSMHSIQARDSQKQRTLSVKIGKITCDTTFDKSFKNDDGIDMILKTVSMITA